MLRQLYISVRDKLSATTQIKHIQYNVIKRLCKLKYVTYRRIDIAMVFGIETGKIDYTWGDDKATGITCILKADGSSDFTSVEMIKAIYDLLLLCFKDLWDKNAWDTGDVDRVFNDIDMGSAFATVTYGKTFIAPGRKHKAEFYCEVFPDYANYFFHLLGNKSSPGKKIQFLKGHTPIETFFMYFNNPYWRDNEYFILSDMNKEVFLLFNISADSVLVEYRPIIGTLEECKNHLRAFEWDVSTADSLRFLGMAPQ